MSDPRELDRIQRWMQAVVTHPAGVAAGLASPVARDEIEVSLEALETVVHRSRAQTAEERLEVYAGAYYARLLECLRGEFPLLFRAVGEDAFDAFCVGYLQHHPSQSYTLGQLGSNFAAWLAADSQAVPDMQAAGWTQAVIDLARLEWAITEVFDGPGAEHETPLDPDQLQAIAPEDFAAMRLACPPCLRLLAFETEVNEYYSALRRDENAQPPAAERSWLALSRRDYNVQRYPLSEVQHDLLAALVRGETIGQAFATASEKIDDLDAFAADLRDWFQQWTREGFFLRTEQ